ncbi:MAG: Gfo/Idh/MocA family oxidoreductase [Pseudomonadota bacterium]
MERIGIGLIGCGMISQAVHLPALAALGNCDVFAACDLRDEPKAAAARMFPGARLLRCVADVFDDPQVTAVVLALPPSENREVALAALDAGRDVYIEKPLAGSLSDGRAIVSAASASDRITMIGFNFRRNHAALSARAAIEAGELGDIISIQSQNHTMQPQDLWVEAPEKFWRTDPKKGGGALSDVASHHIDLAHALTGSGTVRVAASIRSRITPADCAEVQLELANGAVCQISAAIGAKRHVNRVIVTGTRGQIDIDMCDPTPARLRTGEPPYSRSGRVRAALDGFWPLAALNADPGEPSFGAALGTFVRACQTRDKDVEPSLSRGLAVLDVVDTAYRSAEAGGAPLDVVAGAEPA